MNLNIKQIKLTSSNVYLITNDNNESVLVDAGSVCDREVLLEKIKKENIKGIIVTHGHSDRIGNVKEISDMFNTPVYMNKNDYDLFNNQLSHEIYADGFASSMKLNKFKKINQDIHIDMPNKLIDVVNGDNLSKIGFGDIKIITLCGHTRGSIGVLVNKKDLICGDILTYEKGRVCLPFTYEEKASLLNSLEIIKDIFPNKIYPGNGEIFNYDDYFEMEKISLKKEPLNFGQNKK